VRRRIGIEGAVEGPQSCYGHKVTKVMDSGAFRVTLAVLRINSVG
jgi:hypothetical protein